MHTHRAALRQKRLRRQTEKETYGKRGTGEVGEKGGQEETDESGFSPLIVTLKLFCVRAQFCRITYFVFLVCLPHSHILAKLLLSKLKYNANCHGNTPVGFHSLFIEAPKIDLPSKNYSPLIWEATQHGKLDP